MLPISEKDLQNVLKDMDISDINHATIRQCVNVAHELEHISGDKFVHLEFGIPGINACEIGVAAQKKRSTRAWLRFIRRHPAPRS